MRLPPVIAFVATTCIFTSPVQGHDDVSHRFDAVDQGSAHILSSATGPDGHVEMEIEVFGRRLLLALSPVKVYASNAVALRGPSARATAPAYARTYRGRVADRTDSLAALTLDGLTIEGLIRNGSEVYFVAPLEGGFHSVLRVDAAALGFDGGTRGGTPTHELELAAIGDFEWFQQHGAGSEAEIATVINQVDAVYIDQLDTTVRLLVTMVFDTENDPFSDFNSGNTFADFRDTTTEFGNWRASQGGDIAGADIAHLFSDKFGINAGFGFIDTLCSPNLGVSISTTNFQSLHALIVNHEFGHNFGAPHDGEGGACSGEPQNQFIMSPAATGTTFSPCSLGIMINRRDGASCIGAPSVTTTTLPAQVCGDATGEGAITATDALATLQTGVGAGNCALCACDVNASGAVNATDALLVLQGSVGQPVTLTCVAC